MAVAFEDLQAVRDAAIKCANLVGNFPRSYVAKCIERSNEHVTATKEAIKEGRQQGTEDAPVHVSLLKLPDDPENVPPEMRGLLQRYTWEELTEMMREILKAAEHANSLFTQHQQPSGVSELLEVLHVGKSIKGHDERIDFTGDTKHAWTYVVVLDAYALGKVPDVASNCVENVGHSEPLGYFDCWYKVAMPIFERSYDHSEIIARINEEFSDGVAYLSSRKNERRPQQMAENNHDGPTEAQINAVREVLKQLGCNPTQAVILKALQEKNAGMRRETLVEVLDSFRESGEYTGPTRKRKRKPCVNSKFP